MNPFESGAQRIIPAVLVYLRHGTEYLMLYRSGKKAQDIHLGKWNGLGGKCELGETPREAAVREVREESGIVVAPDALSCLGMIQFPNFKPHKKEDWWVTVFRGELALRSTPAQCPEGELQWIDQSKIMALPLWAGDALFLPRVLRGEAFFGSIFYEGENVARAEFSSLPISSDPHKLRP